MNRRALALVAALLLNAPDPIAESAAVQLDCCSVLHFFMPQETPNPNPRGPASLQAPWRLEYLEALGTAEDKTKSKSLSASFLMDYWRDPVSDEKNYVIVRTHEGMILLNAYPYANGHLLAALGDRRPRLLDYDPAQRATLWSLTDLAAELMEKTLEPQGINIGINQGSVAGAGVPQHLHVHLVPRWGGDINFMTVVGQVRVIPSSLELMARRYRETWEKTARRGGQQSSHTAH